MYFEDNPDIIDTCTVFTVEMILPNGQREAAEDGGGVFRDMLTEFWITFRAKCTEGHTFTVPFLKHDMTSARWIIVAQILLLGYKQEKYLPAYLAPIFFMMALEETCTEEEKIEVLIASFLGYVDEVDKVVLQNALANFDQTDIDELVDVLDGYECRKMPTQANFKELLIQIAHKELVQGPAFVIKCWGMQMQQLKPLLNKSVRETLEELQPTTKKVLQIINFPEEAQGEHKKTASFIRKFIKGLSLDLLKSFLRYVTGMYMKVFFLYLENYASSSLFFVFK
jgi:hypothetical protein